MAETITPEQRAHDVATFLNLPADDGIALRVITAAIRAAETAAVEAERARCIQASPDGGDDWYTRHRSQVEAAHAAKRNAWPRHCHSPSSCTRHGACMYMNCRHEGQDIRPAIAAHAAAKETTSGSIDMGLLGKLCREEPDEAAKREVDEMMDRLNGGS